MIDKRYSYWWDFDKDLNIIIESTDPERPILAVFYEKGKYSDDELELVDKVLELLPNIRKKE